MWLQDPNFLGLLEEWWKEEQVSGSKAYCLITKLKRIKQRILNWNKEHLKKIFQEKLLLEEELEKFQEGIINRGMENLTYLKEKELRNKYVDILTKERDILEAKI